MPNQILDHCITCGRCERTCPFKCIHPGPLHYEIDASRCVGCGKCAVPCPVGAITRLTRAEKGAVG